MSRTLPVALVSKAARRRSCSILHPRCLYTPHCPCLSPGLSSTVTESSHRSLWHGTCPSLVCPLPAAGGVFWKKPNGPLTLSLFSCHCIQSRVQFLGMSLPTCYHGASACLCGRPATPLRLLQLGQPLCGSQILLSQPGAFFPQPSACCSGPTPHCLCGTSCPQLFLPPGPYEVPLL